MPLCVTLDTGAIPGFATGTRVAGDARSEPGFLGTKKCPIPFGTGLGTELASLLAKATEDLSCLQSLASCPFRASTAE